ncbi:MAG: DUF3108 domain-containing protein [Ignavibacteriaceae bacterium]|nr:DUF3108 domain-containing protein [Ignavibacteriaceae bacterium]
MIVQIFPLIISAFLNLFSGYTGISSHAGSQSYSFQWETNKEMKVGEDITYLVRYGFIELGEIRLKIVSRKEIGGKFQYNTIAYIDSYSGIPFVNLHQIYESKVNNAYFSDFFRGTVKKTEYTTFTEYYFDYKNDKVKVRKGKVSPYQLWTDSTGIAETMFQDGLSIFYFARMYTGQKRSVSVPCLVNEKKVFTKINFYNKVDRIELPAAGYDVACVRLDGSTDFISVFGLTGYFEGWFSNDKAAIPIIAKLNVIIGRVTVELIKWKRDGWKPPRA